VRDYPDRLLHGVRRASANRALAKLPPPTSVVFVCYGNVCRSPFAAALFADIVRSRNIRVISSSAGFFGPGRQPPQSALDASSRRRINLAAHRSKLVTHPTVRAADLIVVMAPEQARSLRALLGALRAPVLVLGDLDPESIESRTIPDPWGESDVVFDKSYDRIDRCVHELARLLSGNAPGGQRETALAGT